MIRKGIALLMLMMVGLACEELLEEPNISDSEVELLAPTDGVVIFGNEVNFNWNAVDDSRSYRIQLAAPSFANAMQIVFDSLIEQDSLQSIATRIETITLLNGAYQWRVKALNSAYETPYTTASFTIEGDADIDIIAPNTPALLNPTNNFTTSDTEIDFSWTRLNVAGTTEIDSIYIYTDETLQDLFIKGLGANKTFATTLTSETTYYWLVQAFDAGGNMSDDSETYTLTIN